jgi:sugar phosphate isomerase/epimerase
MTITPGLCSVTFRGLTADDVIDVCARAGVGGIEWGADVHAPPGGGPTIAALATRARDAGIAVVSYGSYLGMAPSSTDDVDAALDTADALGAPMVRIWCELGVTPDAPASERARVTEHTAMLVDRIAGRGLLTTLEFHPGTLTETARSATALLRALDRPDVRTHWQPDPALPPPTALGELARVSGHLAHLHVFAWGPTGIDDRRALADGAALWAPAVALADRSAPLPGGRYALCEYVRGDDPEQFVADAHTLRAWLGRLDQRDQRDDLDQRRR